VTPHVARLPATPHIAPQRFARPMQPPITSGGIPSARNLTGTARHIVTPTNQAGRAFALAGAHGAASAHVLRNPFFANRPGLARATFSGRFAQLPWRHHRHLRPIVIGWFGPLFWPYAYDDFLGYTFYPYAYDTFWPYAYDDVYDGMFGLYDSGIRAAYVATGRQQPSSGGRAIGGNICSGQTAGVTDWQINQIAQAVEPDEAQRAALEELKTATAKALDILKAACPSELASTPTGRIEAMHARLSAMLEAVRTVRAPLAKFYDLLSDEQKARFNTLGSGDDQNDPQARRDLTQACNERAAGIAGLPIERMERAVRPDEAQRTAFRDLQNAISEAGELLKSNCPTYKPLTPVVRLDAMEQRLDAMLRAVDTVQPALAKFYGSLSDEQKERFNQLAPGQG
jgi:ABC-type transporter MlaC component